LKKSYQSGTDQSTPTPSEPPSDAAQDDKLIEVSIIASKGLSSLIQFVDGDKQTRRAFVPVKSVVDNKCPEKTIAASVPYGMEWEKFIQPVTISPQTIADALRSGGFWDFHDIEDDPGRAQSIIDRAVSVIAASICRLARQADREAKP